MNSKTSEAEWTVWEAGAGTTRIVYPRAVMAELRDAACDGFHRMAHGGYEIGGVLFGIRDGGTQHGDAVKILAHRALHSEHAFGPSFALSDSDLGALENLLEAPNTDRSLSGMQPVGWYQSHTRTAILLSETELQRFQRYFPETWQIALVLRPQKWGPVRAGFFVREPDGTVQAPSSGQEFVLEGDRSGGADGHPEVLPDSVTRAAPRWPRRRWAWGAIALAAALAAVVWWTAPPRDSLGLSLRPLEAGDQIRIDWNHGSRTIRQGDGGALEIEDGTFRVRDELSKEHLRLGSVTYLRNTGNVLVRLVVRGADQSTFVETRRFSAPPVTAPNPGGSVDRPANVEVTRAAPLERDPPPQVQTAAPRERESPRESRELRAKTQREVPHEVPRPAASLPAHPVGSADRWAKNDLAQAAPLTPAVTATPLRQAQLPPARVAHTAEPLLPAPPPVATPPAEATVSFAPRLPAPAAPAPAAPLVSAPPDEGPKSGRMIWVGKLPRGSTLQIVGDHPSQGRLTGGLPGGPVRLQVFPSEMTQEGLRLFIGDARNVGAPEAPGAQNGWNRTVYVWNAAKAAGLSIQEAPGQQNAWNRLVLRAERGDHSVIVLHWERIGR